MDAALEGMLLNAVRSNPTDDLTALPSELEMYNKDIDKQRLFVELKMLPDLVCTYNEQNPVTAIKQLTNLRTLCDIMNDNILSHAAKVHVC